MENQIRTENNTYTVEFATRANESFYERAADVALTGCCYMEGLFGLGGMMGGEELLNNTDWKRMVAVSDSFLKQQ